MNKKYRELPAFETNEFKVGDMVRSYTTFCDGVVVDNGVGDECFIVVNNGDKLKQEHFKALRKLEEIKAREFYVYDRDIDRLFENKSNVAAVDTHKANDKYIKVREVLEDE